VLAVAFHWFVQPSVSQNYGAPAFNAQAVVARPDSAAPLPSDVAPTASAPSHFAAAPPAATEPTPAAVPPPNAAKKYVARKRQNRERRPWDFAWARPTVTAPTAFAHGSDGFWAGAVLNRVDRLRTVGATG
jgi:hypothetical protein